MKLSFSNLSKDQTNIIKGGAMVFIVLHNFIHMTNHIGENEMSFDPNRIYVLFDTVFRLKSMLFNGFISYFGIYFLQLFIFISGYGLAKQYGKDKSVSYLSYISKRLIKLYALLVFGIIIYFILFYQFFDLNWFSQFAISSLLMYNNFSFETIFLYVGPWWYFSLIVQLYLLFPVLYKILNKYKEKGLFISILCTYVLMCLLYPILSRLNIPMYGNFLGHLPEFLLGMGIAMFPRLSFNLKLIIPVSILFILSNFFELFFPFSFLTATILLLYLLYPVIKYAPVWIEKPLVFFGSISMFMFLINGPLRKYTLPYFDYHSPLYILYGSLIHLAIVILVSYIMSFLYKRVVDPFIKKLISKI